MNDGLRTRLRRMLGGLPRDWRGAADSTGLTIYSIAWLPVDAAFAFDAISGTIWATYGDDGDCSWAAWAGIIGVLAQREEIELQLSDLCALASEMICASGLFLVSNSA